MNVKNVLMLADAIERRSIKDFGFNMIAFHDETEDIDHHPCHSAGCIAGWAFYLANGLKTAMTEFECKIVERRDDIYGSNIEHQARLWLDLDEDQASELFWANLNYSAVITSAEAVACLRGLAATGTVNWVTIKGEPDIEDEGMSPSSIMAAYMNWA